ncbi:MAG: HlyD family efflux transporter periplasmic adaptor subunit [Gammaproteobacteria bacterium]|nr:HlyD family efflux transporter periplasmic adaptor subunit [Gammaproteobacteria bacterium]
MERQRKGIWIGLAALLAVVVAVLAWQRYGVHDEAAGLASGNGRIEAVEVNVATKIPGRVAAILVDEGDFVTAGQVVAQMDTEVLEAQLRQAQAQWQQARSAEATARSQLAQREAEKAAALAAVRQREAELDATDKRAQRSATLATRGAGSQQAADDDRGQALSASAAVSAARAQVAAADAAIATAESQLSGARSAIEAAQASVERIQADIADSALKAPRDGRVQYRVAQPGEVLAAGGRVLNLIDLSDVYMTFFLPTAQAGRLALGTEVRIILDAAPQYVIPARVSFVAAEAQFTPKTVETASEREKLMFRVKAQLPTELLKKHITQVKTGLPGMAYVRIDPTTEWPAQLQLTAAQ